MKPVLTVTPNPAVDMRFAVDELRMGQKLRTDEPVFETGGGGINVSRTIRELGGDSTAFVMACGETGEFLRSMLANAGIDARFFAGDGMTRQAVHVYERDKGKEYQFVPPGPEQRPATLERLWEALLKTLDSGDYAYVVGSGSLPPGLPEAFWCRLAERCRERGARFVLDTSGPPLEAALDTGLYLIKPNRKEVERLRTGDEELGETARQLVEAGRAEVVIVTLGRDGALLVSADGQARLRPPEVEICSNVGAGDSFIGALVYALANDWTLLDACRNGVAAAAAAVTTEASELCRAQDVRRIYDEVEVQQGD